METKTDTSFETQSDDNLVWSGPRDRRTGPLNLFEATSFSPFLRPVLVNEISAIMRVVMVTTKVGTTTPANEPVLLGAQ